MVELTPEFWATVSELAKEWRKSMRVQEFVSVLPENTRKRKRHGMSKFLEWLEAAGLRIRPLALGYETQFFSSHEAIGFVERPEEYQGWIKEAVLIEEAFREQLAFVRSRIPGYPLLRVPQLVKGTASTTEEFTFELVWRRADIASGLQFRQKVANQIPGLPQDSIMTALRSYLQEAEKQAEWQRFSELHRNLELDTVETLRQANVTLRDALKPASIDAFEPEYALRRNQFRNERLQIVKSSLEGTAAEYVDAFQAVNDMINLSLGEVLGQLVAYRRPRELGHIDALDFLGDSEVEFVFAGFERVGMILDISDEAIDQAAQLTGVSMSSSDGKETVRMKARLIPGLRAGLRMAEAL